MRKSAVPALCVQRERLIKHEKSAKKIIYKRKKYQYQKNIMIKVF